MARISVNVVEGGAWLEMGQVVAYVVVGGKKEGVVKALDTMAHTAISEESVVSVFGQGVDAYDFHGAMEMSAFTLLGGEGKEEGIMTQVEVDEVMGWLKELVAE